MFCPINGSRFHIRRQYDAQVLNCRLIHALEQVLDHMTGSVGGCGMLQMLKIFLLCQHKGRDHFADGLGKRRHKGILTIQALSFVADNGHALAEFFDQGRTTHRAEKVLRPHLVFIFKQLTVKYCHAGQDNQSIRPLITPWC